MFNNAHTIERTLKSIINQTFIKFEIIPRSGKKEITKDHFI